jgi:mono/diheme cytochrome c family protein
MRIVWLLTLSVGVGIVSPSWSRGASPISSERPPAAAFMIAQAQPRSAPQRGEVWFYQRCALCHMERIVKDETYMPLGPSLKGLLKDATPSRESDVREFIKMGSLRMPGFRYTLNDQELDELIGFLKTH